MVTPSTLICSLKLKFFYNIAKEKLSYVLQWSRIEILVVSSFNLSNCPFTSSAGVINS